jgi:CheY-like chemotaxis protein
MKRVLVVDDEEIQRRGTAHGLRHEGFEVEVASGCGEAMEVLGTKSIDVVLLDLMMPRVNGLELARMIRSRFPAIRIVLTSAYPLSRRQIERLGLGDIGFVAKLSPLPQLAAALYGVLAGGSESGVVQAPTASGPPPANAVRR